MARISLKGKGTVAEISALLREQIPEVKPGAELAEYIVRGSTELIVFESYGSRQCSLTLSLMLTQSGEEVVVDAVSAGEMDNIFGFNWGFEDDFAFEANKVLVPLNFVIFDRSTDFVEPWEPAEAPEAVPVSELLRRGREQREEKPAADNADWQEIKRDDPERVKLGREEKKGLFGRKRNKPDWEY